jgi:macrodomain Ter protein organizer (MatP/YcbG family)
MTDLLKTGRALDRLIEADAEFNRAQTLLLHAFVRSSKLNDFLSLDERMAFEKAMSAWGKALKSSDLRRIEEQLSALPRKPVTREEALAAIAALKPIALKFVAEIPPEIKRRVNLVARVRAAKSGKKSIDLDESVLHELRQIARERGETLSDAVRALCYVYSAAPEAAKRKPVTG